MSRLLLLTFTAFAITCHGHAQTPGGQRSASSAVASAARPPAAPAASLAPSWETQKQARTFTLNIPAPRGQIVDRNGEPLAQTRVSQNLAIAFPLPLKFSDAQALGFAEQQAALASSIIGRQITVSPDQVFKHYKNRGAIPMLIAQDLKFQEQEKLKKQKAEYLVMSPVYQRLYPNGACASHIIGYAGRAGRTLDGPIQNGELMWPGSEGREGLEQTFDDQLQGKVGVLNVNFDAEGRRANEQVAIPPQPGYNVVTTLDLKLQKLCEQALARSCKRGALVVVDPNNGDILAMASWPMFNPNSFVPTISADAFKALQDDPNIPLLPRAFRSAYPPGSIYKVFVGLAALQSGKVDADDEFSCPPQMKIGEITFRNWKRSDAGSLDFAGALTQSCDTWFYKVGLKIGAPLIIDYSQKVGLGMKTGIPLAAEAPGLIPTDEYMMKVHNRKILNGDIANMSIGQGDTLTTPLQMAAAMGAVGNGGTLYASRLVSQVQSIDGQIVTAYDVRARSQIDIEKKVMSEIRRGMIGVIESGLGTAPKARVSGVHIAGKTGTAQWGPKSKERTAAWFAGFAPADKPKYAFAVVYESDVHNADDVHGGTSAAPIVGRVMREVFREEQSSSKKKKKPKDASDEKEIERPAKKPKAD